MSEFMYVLGAGAALLVIGGVLAGYVDDSGIGNGGTPVGDALFEADIGIIGAVEGTSRTVLEERHVTVSRQSPNRTVREGETLTVSSGAFGGESAVLEFTADRPQTAYISFIASGTPNPSHLTVLLNGEELDLSDYRTGERMTVKADVQAGSNVLEVSAASPGLAVWESYEYAFDGLDITLNSVARTGAILPFRVFDYEITGFDHGELTFDVIEDVVRSEPLEVRINGNPVRSFTPIKRALPYTIKFFANTTGLHAGENTLSLRTTGDAEYALSNMDLDLFFFATDQQRTVTRDFTIPGDRYSDLGRDDHRGQINFMVERSPLRRPMTITLPGESFTITPEPGQNRVFFDQDAVEEGENTVRLATDGSYTITDFNITVVTTN